MVRPPPPDNLLIRAAELRAAGSPWASVADKIDQPADEIADWPTRFADRWNPALRVAQRGVLNDGLAEAVHTLRRLLRADDDKTAMAAAGWLIRL